MSDIELKPCPFCGGRFRWHHMGSIGNRMMRGYAKCDGCGCKMGDDLAAPDDGDLRIDIARLANARAERTCAYEPTVSLVLNGIALDCMGFVCSECGNGAMGVPGSYCPACGAKVVVQ